MKKALVTLGSTIAWLDKVHYIACNSTGKFGIEIASYLKNIDFETSIIYGYNVFHSELDNFKNKFFVKTNHDYLITLKEKYRDYDLLFFPMAVCDFKIEPVKYKIKSTEINNTKWNLLEDIDVLKAINYDSNKITVGFAVENNLDIERAKKKLINKNCKYIVLNTYDTMFSDEIKFVIINNNGIKKFDKMKKKLGAKVLVDYILKTEGIIK